ncbi:MAG: TIGR02300 family protein [Parvularculaceae bacterium]|nr:TIGR02300 family protein [Parvularculaceae bacterium]
MNKPELGVKRDCPQCGARFYDLNKEPAHCPKCDHDFIPEALLKPRKPRREDEAAESETPAAKPAGEVSLAAAEKEQKAPASKKKPGLDGDGDSEDEEEDIEGLGDLDIDIDDDDDDTLLDDDEDEDGDMGGIVSGGDDDES